MVQEACTYVDQVDKRTEQLELIDTLRTVTAGKVCLCNNASLMVLFFNHFIF